MQQSAALLFALEGSRAYGERVAGCLEWPLSAHEERSFEDGEHKIRPLVDAIRRDVFVIHSLYGSPGATPSDKLCRLLFMIGTLKDAGAPRVTAVVPYLCYARKDQRSQSRDPITTKYVARMFEACGADAVMTFDVHNRAAFENALRIPTVNIEAMPLFVEHFARCCGARRWPWSPLMFVGDVGGRAVFLYDDLTSTGTTLRRAAAKCREAGAARIFAATHGLFFRQCNSRAQRGRVRRHRCRRHGAIGGRGGRLTAGACDNPRYLAWSPTRSPSPIAVSEHAAHFWPNIGALTFAGAA